jgi:hypothetical protein
MGLHDSVYSVTNEVIFYTQIATLVGFVFTVFGLYRLLVSAKDATIESVRQQLAASNAKIEELEKRSPSVLVETYARQLELAENMVKKVELERVAAQSHIDKLGQLPRDRGIYDAIFQEAERASHSLSVIHTVTTDYAQMLRYEWDSASLLHELSAARVITEHLGLDLTTISDDELNEHVSSLVRSLRTRVEGEHPIMDQVETRSLMGLSMSVHALFQEGCITTDDRLTGRGLQIMREGARLARKK